MTDLDPEFTAAKPPAKKQGMLRASTTVGFMSMISRFLGLTRDIIIARIFGPGDGLDAFLVANKIPNFLRRLFAEGAFNQAFVPVLSEYRSQKTFAEVKQLVDAVAGSLGSILLVVTVIVVVAAPYIAVPIAYGFTDEPAKFALFVDMLRITFPYLLLISITGLCGSILNSYDRFAVPALTPALLNISLIASSLLLTPYMGVPEVALAWGVLIAGVAQCLFQIPFLAKIDLLPVPRIIRDHEGVKRIKTLMIPALFGVSVSQINLLLDTLIATFLVSSSVTWLYYSDRLVELPLGIFGIAIATVVLPNLSRKHAAESVHEFAETLDWALRIVCLIAVPATIALIVIAEPLLVTLFQNDIFTGNDVARVTGSLRAYAIGLLAFMAVKIFAPGYFSRQDTKTPVKVGIIAMCSNMVLNLVLVFGFGLAHVGLALATSLAAFINAGLLFWGLKRDQVFRFQSGWWVFLLRMALANGTMLLFLLYFKGDLQQWLDWGIWTRIFELSILCVGGVLIYCVMLIALGMRMRHLSH